MQVTPHKCLVCNNEVKQLPYLNEHFRFLDISGRNIFKDLTILGCDYCGFAYAFPFLGEVDLDRFYKDDYGAEGGPHYEFIEIKTYEWVKHVNTRFFSQLLLASQYIDFSSVNNMLDVGANVGESFATIRKMGYNPACFALEKGSSLNDRLKELGVTVLTAKDGHLSLDETYNNKFDLIIISHVLEHFSGDQLYGVLVNLRKYLSEKGVMVCEIPNDDCRIRHLGGMNSAPHLCFFSMSSLENMFTAAGFTIKYANTVGEKIVHTANNAVVDARLNGKPIKHFTRYPLVFVKSIKGLLKRIKAMLFVQNIFLYLLRYVKTRATYLKTDHLSAALRSKDFVYGVDRANIRFCLGKNPSSQIVSK